MTTGTEQDPGRSLLSYRNDLVAGLIVGVIALPLSLALAVAVGAQPVTGLYTAAFAGATAAIFGGSRFNITGPTAALVPLLSHVTFRYGPEALPMVGVMAGLILLLMSRFRLGRLVRFMPGPVIVGFTAGIGLSIAFGQLNNLLGVSGTDPTLEHFHEKLFDTVGRLASIGITTLAIGLGALVLLLVWQRAPRLAIVPGPLVAILLFTTISWSAGVETPTIASQYGELPSKPPLPTLDFLNLDLVFELLPSALAIAVLAGIESLLSAVVADGMARTSTKHDSDRELFGQGLANLIGPVMGGIPATAAIARTAAGVRSGGSSRLTGVFHSVTVLCAAVVLAPLAGHIPLAVLAAVLVVVAWNIAELPELAKLLHRAPRQDVGVLLVTVALTLFFDLTYAIGFGLIASMLLLINQLMKQPVAKALLPDDSGRVQEVSPELSKMMLERPDISFFTVQGMLSFHSAAAFEYELNADLSKPLVLRMKDVGHIDTSGLLTLEGIIEHRQRHGSRIMLSALQPATMELLARFGIVSKIGPDNIFPETRLAIAALPRPGMDAAPRAKN